MATLRLPCLFTLCHFHLLNGLHPQRFGCLKWGGVWACSARSESKSLMGVRNIGIKLVPNPRPSRPQPSHRHPPSHRMHKYLWRLSTFLTVWPLLVLHFHSNLGVRGVALDSRSRGVCKTSVGLNGRTQQHAQCSMHPGAAQRQVQCLECRQVPGSTSCSALAAFTRPQTCRGLRIFAP
jgi:hypothetical protein